MTGVDEQNRRHGCLWMSMGFFNLCWKSRWNFGICHTMCFLQTYRRGKYVEVEGRVSAFRKVDFDMLG